MFKKKYKYFISFWYELDNCDSRICDSYVEAYKKINFNKYLSEIREEFRNIIQDTTHRKCNFVAIINWKKLK